MLISLFIVGIILGIISDCVSNSNKDLRDMCVAACCVFTIGSTIFMAYCGYELVNGRNLERQIALYEEENTAIEHEINILVEKYMNYETDIYENLKGESGITLVSLYPELKADTLVRQQCDLYISNKEQITSLKEQQIKLSSLRFWLYFGK